MKKELNRYRVISAVLLTLISEAHAQSSVPSSEKYAQSLIPIEHIAASSSNRVSQFLETQVSLPSNEDKVVENIKAFIEQASNVYSRGRKETLSDLGLKCDEVSCVYIGAYRDEAHGSHTLTSTAVEIQIKVIYTALPIEIHVLHQSIRKDSTPMNGSPMGEFLHLAAPFESKLGLTRQVRAFIKEAPVDLREVGFICTDLCRYEGEQSTVTYVMGKRVAEKYRYTIHVSDSKRPESIVTRQEKIN